MGKPNPVQRITIYVGYGEKGKEKKAFLKDRFKKSNISLSRMFLDFCKMKFPDFPQGKN